MLGCISFTSPSPYHVLVLRSDIGGFNLPPNHPRTWPVDLDVATCSSPRNYAPRVDSGGDSGDNQGDPFQSSLIVDSSVEGAKGRLCIPSPCLFLPKSLRGHPNIAKRLHAATATQRNQVDGFRTALVCQGCFIYGTETLLAVLPSRLCRQPPELDSNFMTRCQPLSSKRPHG